MPVGWRGKLANISQIYIIEKVWNEMIDMQIIVNIVYWLISNAQLDLESFTNSINFSIYNIEKK